MTATTAAKTAAAPVLNNCLCSTFEIVTREFEVNGEPDYDAETTGCNETTAREFAPGHDAKLKSLLIRAGVAGFPVRRNLGGMASTSDAAGAARDFAFGYMVQTGIERGLAKQAAKTEKKAARKSAPKAKAEKVAVEMPRKVGAHVVATIAQAVEAANTPEAPAADVVRIKLGRWEYSAVIAPNGDANYKTAKGADAHAVAGTFKVIA